MSSGLGALAPPTGVDGLRTEYPFTLPRGFVDPHGVLHRDGVMRLATARDELTAQVDSRVRQNQGYLTVALLERTVVRLGSLPAIDGLVVESLFASDLAFLQDLYQRINQLGHTEAQVECPACAHEFAVDVTGDAPGGA